MSANILVVDDEPAVREMLGEWLEPEGYRLHLAGGADQALDLVERGIEFDLALLDLAMPGENGVWVARKLRDRQPEIGIIMCTGWQSFDAAVEGMRIGVNDYLLKPFTRAELLDAISRALKWRQEVRRAQQAQERIEQGIADRRAQLMDVFRAVDHPSPDVLEGLVAQLATRSGEARAHARRVARMSVLLAGELGVTTADLVAIEYGALLHDIGKVALPDDLMLKDSPITDDEILLIRTHPELGAAIVGASPALADAAGIVRSSHEAWDGSGYPAGLAGSAIPLGARIIAVTDTYDALTWSRAYREPVTTARAAAELVRSAGTQFDPAVVNAWLRVLDGSSMSRVA